MLLALDDTDGPDGGCTTHVAARLARALGPDVVAGPPRLVRLYPSNRWKTRGNAAAVLELSDDADPDAVLDGAWDLVRRAARVAPGKGAGLALFHEAPDPDWYERGVRGEVPMAAALAALEGVSTRTLGNGRGLVGCLCAAAWRPGTAATWEWIAYRPRRRWATERRVDVGSLRAVEERFDEVFSCVDPASGHPVMVPRTPCPVLYGLRATGPERLAQAAESIESEPVDHAALFVSNQASDDHVDPARLERLTVAERAQALPGGHVRLVGRRRDGGEMTCMAFEPTGRLRRAVRAMEPGDGFVPVGDHRERALHLEKLLHLPGPRRRHQPCPSCGRALSSTGRDGPVRCRGCGHREPARFERPAPTWYEADVSAQRHLHRPLSLGLADRVAQAVEDVAAPAPTLDR